MIFEIMYWVLDAVLWALFIFGGFSALCWICLAVAPTCQRKPRKPKVKDLRTPRQQMLDYYRGA